MYTDFHFDKELLKIEGMLPVQAQLSSLGAEFPVRRELLEWAKGAEYTTVPQLFLRGYRASAQRPYLGRRVGGEFVFETYEEVYGKVRSFASALLAIGLKPGDRVANFSNNRPEWPVVDLGCAFAACVHLPMYATLSKEELAFIVRDSGARCVVVGTEEHLRKMLAIEDQCPELEFIISISTCVADSTKKFWGWQEFLEYGKVRLCQNSSHIDYLVNHLSPWDVHSLVYTSGTTGDPKGVMLMHGNFCSQVLNVIDRIHAVPEDVQLSFLPLSHVFERVVYYCYTSVGASIAYANGIHSVMQDLQILSPSVFPCVPLLLHKIYDRMMERPDLKRAPSLKWAIKVGRSYSAAQRAGKVSRILQAQQAMARSVISKMIKKRLGGNMKVVISGGAPLRPEVARFFKDIDVRILEGYGLTETSPVIAVNPFEDSHPGTVGTVLPCNQVKIDDGEIVERGPNIMRGYYKHPAATAASFDMQGWFHTGDIGELDEMGYLHITDRKKEIIVLANGKNVAPAGIEQLLCRSHWIARAVLVGDNAQYVAALIVPDMEKLSEWAESQGLAGTAEDWVCNDEFKSLVNGEVHDLCRTLSNYEKIKRIAILPHDFSLEAGELTHSMKVKHRVVEDHYADLIRELLHQE